MFNHDLLELIFGYPVYIFGYHLQIYLYGIMIALGIVVCLIVFYYYTKHKKMDSSVQDFIFFVALIAIALGFLAAKFFQAIYDWIERGYFDFYHAGITAMGGFIGGAAAFLIVYFGWGHFYFKGNKKDLHKKEFNKILLTAPICITIAHAFGRIGCLSAGCCHGAYLGKDYVVGGIWMEPNDGSAGFYVPTQLYEALFLFALFGVLTWMFYKRSNITHAVYLFGYGVWRLFIEFFRTDYRGAIILGLAPSQWQSFVFILGAIAILIFYKVKKYPFVLPPEKEIEEVGNVTENIENSDDKGGSSSEDPK